MNGLNLTPTLTLSGIYYIIFDWPRSIIFIVNFNKNQKIKFKLFKLKKKNLFKPPDWWFTVQSIFLSMLLLRIWIQINKNKKKIIKLIFLI